MKEPYGFLRDGNDDKSMARLLALMVQAGGTTIIAVGLALIVVAFFIDARDQIGGLIGLVSIGAGLDLAGPAMKNWSKRAETRMISAEGVAYGSNNLDQK